jgi:hypothetical protein
MLKALFAVYAFAAPAGQFPFGDKVIKAHWLYELTCCGAKDCWPLDEDAVEATPRGWFIKSNATTLSYDDKRVKLSPDGRFHGCFRGAKPSGETICLYVPSTGS